MSSTSLAVIVLVSMLASAFFSGVETAVVSCSKVRLRSRARRGSWRAQILEGLLRRPEKFFSLVLVGNNLANVACMATATALAVRHWGDSGAAVATIALTPALLVVGEVIPKSAFLYHADRVALLLAPPIRAAALLLQPLVAPAALLARALTGLTGRGEGRFDILSTREELVYLYRRGRVDTEIAVREQRIIGTVFSFGARSVGELMVPMENVITFPVTASVDEVVEEANRHTYSRFPLVSPRDGRIVGVVSLFDLLGLDGGERLASVMHTPLYVHPEEKAERLLIRMKDDPLHFAVVISGAGEATGIITLENILESFVGEISNEYE
ncbi:MAG: CNNM domain-containing protein [Candidatus Krumholzibacteria bacterium]|nr:CNNM domain-containing protein [Candidatus Krumholzibacteria bacterium]